MFVPLQSKKIFRGMKHFLIILSAILFSWSTGVKAGNAGKTLVVYYSYTGNCRAIVNTLTSQIEADVLEIQPAEKGLKYEANNYALGTQLLNAIKANPNDASSYPAIDPVTTSLSSYQNIIIVTPLWWSQMAAIMQTYLFNNSSQMAGKHVGLIVSSHSSGISGVVADARRLLPDVTWMGDALWINASNLSNRASLIEDWLPTQNFAEAQTTSNKMYITISGQTQSVTLEDNEAARSLAEKLQQAPVTVTLNSSGGFEIWLELMELYPPGKDRRNVGERAAHIPESRRKQHQRYTLTFRTNILKSQGRCRWRRKGEHLRFDHID